MARTAATQNSPVASARPTRVPLSNRNRLSIKNKEPGYIYRIVNDQDDRVERLQEIGYEIAPKESVGAVGNKQVDSASSLGSVTHFSVGRGTKAVVMRQREEDFKEDQRMKQDEIDELESTMRSDVRKAADYGTFDVSK
jgi:hypothetical protein